MSNVMYTVKFARLIGAVKVVEIASEIKHHNLKLAIEYGTEFISGCIYIYNHFNHFEVIDSRGVIYNRTGKQISGHKWVYWLKGEVGIPSCKGENTEEEAHKAAVRHIKNLSEVFLKNGIYHRSYYVKPFASWVPHWIPSDVESLQCQTVNLTPPATAPIPNPTSIRNPKYGMLPEPIDPQSEVLLNLLAELSQVLVALDAPDHVLDKVWAAIEGQPLPYESLLLITKHQAITRARSLGLSDEELKAMGVEV